MKTAGLRCCCQFVYGVSDVVTPAGFLPWSKLLARRQAGLLERERAALATMDLMEGKREEQAARAQLRRNILGTIVEQRVMVYVHQVEVSACMLLHPDLSTW